MTTNEVYHTTTPNDVAVQLTKLVNAWNQDLASNKTGVEAAELVSIAARGIGTYLIPSDSFHVPVQPDLADYLKTYYGFIVDKFWHRYEGWHDRFTFEPHWKHEYAELYEGAVVHEQTTLPIDDTFLEDDSGNTFGGYSETE